MKKLLFTILVIIFCINTFSQVELPIVTNPISENEMLTSPNVGAFQKQNFLPINLYTGKVNVTIPIYKISIDGLSIPISLSYSTGGVKVDEVASNVGLGWSLNAGGNITRIIKGVEDNSISSLEFDVHDDYEEGQGTREFTISSIGYHRKKAPYFFDGWTINYPFTESWDKVSIDSSPDLYNAIAPGLNSNFFLEDKHKNDYNTIFQNRQYNAVFVNHSNVKIENTIARTNVSVTKFGFSEDGNPSQSFYANTSSVIFDASFNLNNGTGSSIIYYKEQEMFDFSNFSLNKNGFIYTFNNKDIIETYKLPILNRPSSLTHYDSKITSWHLESISSPVTNKTISFGYEQYSKSTLERVLNYKGTRSSGGGYGFYSPNAEYIHSEYSYVGGANGFINSNEILTKYPRLNRITTINWDGGSVEFHYNHVRLDYIGEKALTEVIIKNNYGEIIKKIKLFYDYFLSKEGCNDSDCKRLRLNKVSLIGNNDIIKQDYILDYNYNNPLPRRTSLQKDYLGYYNNNGMTHSYVNYLAIGPNPKLYFHPNKGKYSILPFHRNDVAAGASREISGYSIEPNNYSLSGTLKRITYPTKGFSEFEYETHKFYFYGYEYTAGGARIKKQKLNDGQGNERVFNYTYTEIDGKSSGYINNIPVFGYPNTNTVNINASENAWLKSFTTFDKYTSGMEYTSGSYVGYSRIIEQEVGNGSTEYIYSSPKDYPNTDEVFISAFSPNNFQKLSFLFNNSAYLSRNHTNNEIKRGKLLSKTIKSETNENLVNETFEYTYNLFGSYSIPHETSISNNVHASYETFSFITESKLNIERNLQTKKILTEFYNGNTIVTTKDFIFDGNYPLIKESKTTNAEGVLKTNIYYPLDTEVSTMPYMADLVNANRIAEPIKIKTFKDGLLLGTKLYNYHNFGIGVNSSIIAKKSLSTSKGMQNLEEGAILDIKDTKGNILQFHTQDNVYTSFIWGYNKQYIVAKIEGERLTSIPNTLINQIHTYSNGTENLFLTKLAELRNIPALAKAKITTYTYKPLIGLSTMTDFTRNIQYYTYDGFNRLKYVKDKDGNILKEHAYHYKQ